MALTIQSLLQQYFDRYRREHPLAGYQCRAAEQMRDCRTAAMGGHVVRCPNGHVEKVCYNACQHRNCPLCSLMARERWLANWKERLLDCPHHHVTLTVPHELVPLWQYNKEAFPAILFRAGIDTLRDLLDDEKYLGAVPGMLAGFHSWTQTLAKHPHVHILVTAGGLDEQGRWQTPKKGCLLPVPVVMKKFRGKMCDYLKKAVAKGELTLPPDTTATRVKNLLNKLGRVKWKGDVSQRMEHGSGVATYLAAYLRGGPIGNGRLLEVRDGRVFFTYRGDREEDECEARGRRKTTSLEVDEFIGRLLEHVPPPNKQMVRGYGLYASSKQEDLAKAREHFGQEPRPAKVEVTWQDLLVELGHEDKTVCPVCGARLVVESHFGRGPPRRFDERWSRAA
jgi:hypothetical protein